MTNFYCITRSIVLQPRHEMNFPKYEENWRLNGIKGEVKEQRKQFEVSIKKIKCTTQWKTLGQCCLALSSRGKQNYSMKYPTKVFNIFEKDFRLFLPWSTELVGKILPCLGNSVATYTRTLFAVFKYSLLQKMLLNR